MFKFLKNLFKEPEPESINLRFNEIEDWFNKKSKDFYKDLDNQLEKLKQNLGELRNKTKENLIKLKEAKLKNPNIPERAKNMMEGNRESYIRLTKTFIENIDLNKDYNELIQYCSGFKDNVEKFGKSTSRSYQILNEFFAHEVRDIAINIKNIDNHIKDVKSTIKRANIDEIETIKQEIKNINNKTIKKDELENSITDKEIRLKKIKEELEKQEKIKQELQNSDNYKQYQELLKQKSELETNLRNLKDPITQSFSIINKALKKYERIAFDHNQVINLYLNNPNNTLINDKDLIIVQIIGNLKNNIEKLSLDEKKKSRTIQELSRLDKDYFINFLNKYEEIKNEIKKINESLKNNKIIQKIDQINESITFQKNKLSRKNIELETIKKDYEKINIDNLKKSLINNINKTLKIKLILKENQNN